MNVLETEVDKADDVLGQLEDILVGFQSRLENVKNDMEVIEDKCNFINRRVGNRKKLQKELRIFVDQAVIEPELVDAILNKPVDKDYVENIKLLCEKLEFLNSQKMYQGTNAVKELEPELNKLKTKAGQRIKDFIIDKISQLKKPKANI